jgi:hypothetical protein
MTLRTYLSPEERRIHNQTVDDCIALVRQHYAARQRRSDTIEELLAHIKLPEPGGPRLCRHLPCPPECSGTPCRRTIGIPGNTGRYDGGFDD